MVVSLWQLLLLDGTPRGLFKCCSMVKRAVFCILLFVSLPQRRYHQSPAFEHPSCLIPFWQTSNCTSKWVSAEDSFINTFLPNSIFFPTEALPKVELIEVLFAGNHSLASDYGVSYEPYGMYMDSGEPYTEPLLLDAAASGSMHLVYHHCPYTDAKLRGWKFKGNQFITSQPGEAPVVLERRRKMCVARRVEIRSDGEQEGSELTLTTGAKQEPRFFGYRVDDQGYTSYFVAFTRMPISACLFVSCCRPNANLPCEFVFYDVRNHQIQSLFQHVVGAQSAALSRECLVCHHHGGEDGVPLEYFTSIDDNQLSIGCPSLEPHTSADTFVFVGPGNDGSRVHKHYAIGSLSNTLQIRDFAKMTQVSVQYPNNLWLSRAGAYHENFNPPEAVKSYYIVRGAEYTTADLSRKKLQEVLFFYDSLANAHDNKGSQFISGLKKREAANTKIADAIFAEHPIANDMSYFHSNPMDHDVRFVAGGGFKLPSSKFVDPAAIKGFCVAPLFYDQWAVFLALEEPEMPAANDLRRPRPLGSSSRSVGWESTPLPWWNNDPMPGYSYARRGQVLYMQVPISGTRSYNEVALQVFNADSYRSFHCSSAGSASVLLLYHDAVNHILHMEERLRDGSLREESQVEIRRVLHGSLLPSRTVMALQKGPDSVLWVNMLTTKRLSVDESFYYVPADLPGRVASIQRATGFYKDGDCVGESALHHATYSAHPFSAAWFIILNAFSATHLLVVYFVLMCCRWAPPLASATCSEFCVSLHAYQVKVPSRGGSACAFQKGTELSKHCLALPCSRGEIETIEFNHAANGSTTKPPTAPAPLKYTREAEPAPVGSQIAVNSGNFTEKPYGKEGEVRSDVLAISPELQAWQDTMMDTSAQVPLGGDGVASATVRLKTAVDVWHLRIAFTSASGQENLATSRVASFEFSLAVMDDADEEIHTWNTSVPPSPAAQSVWEAMDLRLYRARIIRIKALQPFRVAEVQVFGMPLPQCPPGGFLGPSGCNLPTVKRLRSHSSLDCQGAWSEWTACQADCRRKRFMQVYQTEKEGGVPCQFFQQEPCEDGLCNSIFGLSLLKSEDCYPSPSRWSECVGCRQMRVWHILRAASAAGKACPSTMFETRACKTGEGCDVNPVHFPTPPDQPATGGSEGTKEVQLMRPIGGIFLAVAVALVFLLLAALEIWRRWGISMAAQREVLNIQRQRDLITAREQIREYRQMIQNYKEQLENEETGSTTEANGADGDQIDSFLMQHVVAVVAEEGGPRQTDNSTPPDELLCVSNSDASAYETEETEEGEESKKLEPSIVI